MESNDPSTESSRRYQMWGSLAAVVIGLGVSLAGYPWAAVTMYGIGAVIGLHDYYNNDENDTEKAVAQ